MCKLTEKEHGPTTQDSKFSESSRDVVGAHSKAPRPECVCRVTERRGQQESSSGEATVKFNLEIYMEFDHPKTARSQYNEGENI